MFCQHQVVRLSLVNAHCAAHYSMHTKYTVQCTLCTLVNAHCAHYSMQTVHIIQCTVYTLFNAQCEHHSMHIAQCAQCTALHWSMPHCNIQCTAQRLQCKTGRHCTTNGCIIKCTTRLHSNLMHWSELFNAAAFTVLDAMYPCTLVS